MSVNLGTKLDSILRFVFFRNIFTGKEVSDLRKSVSRRILAVSVLILLGFIYYNMLQSDLSMYLAAIHIGFSFVLGWKWSKKWFLIIVFLGVLYFVFFKIPFFSSECGLNTKYGEFSSCDCAGIKKMSYSSMFQVDCVGRRTKCYLHLSGVKKEVPCK